MSAQHTGRASTRLLLFLGVGLLLVAVWYGGQMSAGGGLPFGMMERHGEGMMHERSMQGRSAQAHQQMGGGNDFDGEAGLRRCRAMMGTYRYDCTPHAGVGMPGAVIVSSD